MEPNDNASIVLDLETIRSLMFVFPSIYALDTNTQQSRYRREPEPFFPVAVPVGLGRLLEERDNKGNPKFQIFHYTTHAEVWHIDHWKLSNSRRHYILHQSPAAISRDTGRRTDEIVGLLKKHFPALAHESQGTQLHALALALSKAPKEVTEKIPGLNDILYPPCPQT
jgi:hypothetical protein